MGCAESADRTLDNAVMERREARTRRQRVLTPQGVDQRCCADRRSISLGFAEG